MHTEEVEAIIIGGRPQWNLCGLSAGGKEKICDFA